MSASASYRVAVLTVLVAVSLAGCGGTEAVAPNDVRTAATSGAAGSSAGVPQRTDVAGADVGVPGLVALRQVELSNGSYTQVTLADDSPALAFDATMVQPDVRDSFSAEDLSALNAKAARFLAEEGFDSAIADNADVERQLAWLKENSDRFTSACLSELRTLASQEENMGAVISSYTQRQRPSYSMIADGGARVTDLEITPIQIYANDTDGVLIYQAEGIITRKTDASTGDGIEIMSVDAHYAFVMQDGQWKLSGWENTWNTVKAGDA